MSLWILPANAGPADIPTSVDEGQAFFGHYNQVAPAFSGVCGGTHACGVVAALNSFVFLQNEYEIYGGHGGHPARLLPDPSSAASVTATAQTLADDMGCPSTCSAHAININNFISGKQKYIDSVAPGTTRFTAQSVYEKTGTPTTQTKPAPTMKFIMQELADAEDVEVLIGFWQKKDGVEKRVGGHYMTLTGGTVNDANGDGRFNDGDTPNTLSFIQGFFMPADGSTPSFGSGYSMTTNVSDVNFAFPGGPTEDVLDLTNFFSTLKGKTNHPDRKDDNTTVVVEAAVSESPVPEPPSIASLSLSVAMLFLVARPVARRK